MKPLLIAVGAFLVYEWYKSSVAPTSVPVTNGSNPQGTATVQGSNTNGPQTSTQMSTQASSNTLQAVGQAAKSAGTDPTSSQTFDVWNFYYNRVTGKPGPDPSTYLSGAGLGRSALISINTWWSLMGQAGFSGIAFGVNPRNPFYDPIFLAGAPYGSANPTLKPNINPYDGSNSQWRKEDYVGIRGRENASGFERATKAYVS